MPNKGKLLKAKESGKILASALYLSKTLISSNITPSQIDREIDKFIRSKKAVPSFFGFEGFPNSSCISVNDQVVHGVPSSRPLEEGDLITIDIGVKYNGFCTDAARTYVVGKHKDTTSKNLIKTAKKALDESIKVSKDQNRVGDISYTIQREVEMAGYRSPLELGGHGIGRNPHQEPFIPNAGPRAHGPVLKSGMVIAIEPIVMETGTDLLIDRNDGFTIYSKDGGLSAHMEDTVMVADKSPIILTRETLSGGII